MGIWGFYFIIKIILSYKGVLRLDIPWNIAFAFFLLLPLPRWLGKYAAARWTRGLLNLVLAVLLLWHDSWFPPLMDTIAFVKQQGLPQKEYIFNFVSRYYNGWMLIAAAGLLTFCIIANHYIKLVPVTIAAMMVLIPFNIYTRPDSTEMNAGIEGFYEGEATRVINMKKPDSGNINFDIVFLHVCSLAWDDLKEVGLENHPFFKQFQYLYTDFNSVTTYSGPAMIRLLKGNCGQVPHNNIYGNMPDECYTMNVLERIGFQQWSALNHDGVYGEFAKELVKYGRLKTAPINLAGIPANQRMFDDSPVHDDYGVLERWWEARRESDKPAAALYYNTVTLHDGAHWATDRDWFKRDRKVLYYEFASKMLDDFGKFFTLLEKSGRNVIVIFVPEHGIALRGFTTQAPGLRDIPLPTITDVPVGVKLIGNGFNGRPLRQTIMDKPASYLALASQLAFFIEKNPFDADGMIPKRMLDNLPFTDHVAENQSAKVMRSGLKYYLLAKNTRWVELQKSETE